jgi:hypothetical protein
MVVIGAHSSPAVATAATSPTDVVVISWSLVHSNVRFTLSITLSVFIELAVIVGNVSIF